MSNNLFFFFYVCLQNLKHSGMDLLTWPNVTLEQFQDLLPELKHLEPSLKERVMIEGNECSDMQRAFCLVIHW